MKIDMLFYHKNWLKTISEHFFRSSQNWLCFGLSEKKEIAIFRLPGNWIWISKTWIIRLQGYWKWKLTYFSMMVINNWTNVIHGIIFFWVVKNPFTFIVHIFQDVIFGREWPWRHIVTLSLKNVISSHQHYFLHDIEENNILNISYYSNVVFLFDIVTPLYTMKKSVASDNKSRTILHKRYRWSGVWYHARISAE